MYRILIAAFIAGTAVTAHAADPLRGKQLFETTCISCHEDNAFTREKRLAKDYPELRAQVQRWESNLGLHWSEEDIGDVTRYLNSTYYGFACPAGVESC